MPEFTDDLIAVNKQLREERDHYRRALKYVCETIANVWSDKSADDIFDDALFEVARG